MNLFETKEKIKIMWEQSNLNEKQEHNNFCPIQ